MQSIVIITGISGSGKSIALRQLEDSGYHCVDNLPISLLKNYIDNMQKTNHEYIAAAIDARSHADIQDMPAIIHELRGQGFNIKVLYLDSSTEILTHRYSESRRAHPLTHRIKKDSHRSPSLEECISHERKLLSVLKEKENVIDTTVLKPQELRAWVNQIINVKQGYTLLTFESFAYKIGVPSSADLVFDVRCLPNPYYEVALRALTGRDADVIKWLEKEPSVSDLINDISNYIKKWLPFYLQDTRSYLTVAIGCTGGQHRSVYVAEKLASIFSFHKPLHVRHRALPTLSAQNK